jgi:hypothetical protein
MDPAQVIAMLQAVIAQVQGETATPSPSTPPPGFVAVSPTGPQGAGKTRFWPQPHPEQGEMLLGYAGRCMNTIDQTTHLPYFSAGSYGMILQGGGNGAANMAEALDRIKYPMDWMTQAQLDAAAAATARDNATGAHFSPGA